MGKYVREPINGITHLIGAILSVAGLLALVIKTSIKDPSITSLTAVIIFGISLILLYSASSTYHLTIASDSRIKFLRKIDHFYINSWIICSILFNNIKRTCRIYLIWYFSFYSITRSFI